MTLSHTLLSLLVVTLSCLETLLLHQILSFGIVVVSSTAPPMSPPPPLHRTTPPLPFVGELHGREFLTPTSVHVLLSFPQPQPPSAPPPPTQTRSIINHQQCLCENWRRFIGD